MVTLIDTREIQQTLMDQETKALARSCLVRQPATGQKLGSADRHRTSFTGNKNETRTEYGKVYADVWVKARVIFSLHVVKESRICKNVHFHVYSVLLKRILCNWAMLCQAIEMFKYALRPQISKWYN